MQCHPIGAAGQRRTANCRPGGVRNSGAFTRTVQAIGLRRSHATLRAGQPTSGAERAARGLDPETVTLTVAAAVRYGRPLTSSCHGGHGPARSPNAGPLPGRADHVRMARERWTRRESDLPWAAGLCCPTTSRRGRAIPLSAPLVLAGAAASRALASFPDVRSLGRVAHGQVLMISRPGRAMQG